MMDVHTLCLIAVAVLAPYVPVLALAVFVGGRDGAYARKLAQELELWRWYTLDKLVELGYERARCESALPLLHAGRQLEVSSTEPRVGGFHIGTVELHKFRLVARGEGGGSKEADWRAAFAAQGASRAALAPIRA